jgi:UDP-N-acetylmuramoylalanine--D-glutamate ligase
VSVLVAGLGVSGAAAARVLLGRGTAVLLTDAAEPAALGELVAAGATWLGAVDTVPDGVHLVVTSPGWRPDHPLLADASARGIEVVGEPELAWRLRPGAEQGTAAPWLAVTGTNGKTTTVLMLEAVLLAAGHRAVAAGNVGRPLVEVVTATDADGTPAYDVVAVELSSFQLHWSSSIAPAAAVVLNVADDHTDWHGSFAAYRDAKATIFRGAGVAVAAADDPVAAALVTGHPKPVTVTLGQPAPGQLGVRGGALVDRAFADDPAGVVLLEAGALQVPGPHNVLNALAAAALARAAGVPPEAVGRGLAGFRGGAHRNVRVASIGGVDWVDDSKATNPHAAGASLAAYPRVVWIAGGLLKGADVDPLVAAVAPRLSGVVLMGRDRAVVAASLA